MLAKREYEAWFLAAAGSIAGKHRLPEHFPSPMDPEQIPAAKGILNRALRPHGKYSETVDQPALTSIFDINEARRAPSFDKCYREIERLMALAAPVS